MKLRLLLENEIIRRYVVINSFDGALTILGILLAEFFAGIKDPRFIIYCLASEQLSPWVFQACGELMLLNRAKLQRRYLN